MTCFLKPFLLLCCCKKILCILYSHQFMFMFSETPKYDTKLQNNQRHQRLYQIMHHCAIHFINNLQPYGDNDGLG